MRSGGEFVDCDFHYREAPARVASLLKFKKHEWIVVAFISSLLVRRLWWNKGPDRTQVRSFLEDDLLKDVIRALGSDAIAVLHNHPNPDPSRYRTNIPSETDLRSADVWRGNLSHEDVSLLEFVCERGVPYLDETFTYGSGEDAVELHVRLPVRHCEACDFHFIDHVGERIQTEVVYRHHGLLSPWEIRAIRERRKLSRDDPTRNGNRAALRETGSETGSENHLRAQLPLLHALN